MSDFLGNIIRRVQPVSDLTPRLCSRFESPQEPGPMEPSGIQDEELDTFREEAPPQSVPNPLAAQPSKTDSFESKSHTSPPQSTGYAPKTPESPPAFIVQENSQNAPQPKPAESRPDDQPQPTGTPTSMRRNVPHTPPALVPEERLPVSRRVGNESSRRDLRAEVPQENRSDAVSALEAVEQLAVRLKEFREETQRSGNPILQTVAPVEKPESPKRDDHAPESEPSVPVRQPKMGVPPNSLLAWEQHERSRQRSPILAPISAEEIAEQVFSRFHRETSPKLTERTASGVLSSPAASPRVVGGEQPRSSGKPQPVAEKIIHVTIGRIEIKAPAKSKAGNPEPSARPAPSRVMTLDEYIARRSTGGIA